ncbi:GGDEF domain-containing protein [Sphingosinicellaceae bacterium]|nr:GGDEF domain-containing protein [Sphingosinicellaceae bacterium]
MPVSTVSPVPAEPLPRSRAHLILTRILDARVDEAARDGEKTFVARLVALWLMSAIVAANLGFGYAVPWTCLGVAGELMTYLSKRQFRADGPASLGARAGYVVTAFAVVLVWTSLPLLFWFSPGTGLNGVATLVLATLMIHAQAFAFRSISTLVAVGGPPALLLLILPWVSELRGVERLTFALVTVIAIGYACASIGAHRATARSLSAAQDELERFAYIDVLTTLANRRRFSENLRDLIAMSRRRGTRFALLLIDLDLFKQVNDTLGHDAGDALLIEVGARLRAAVRAQDDVARLGGDEFAVLLSDADDAPAIAAVCERIASSSRNAIEFDGARMQSSLSVGVALFPDNGTDQDSLYKSADLALYQAKRSGRNAWRYSQASAEKPNSRARARTRTVEGPRPPGPIERSGT